MRSIAGARGGVREMQSVPRVMARTIDGSHLRSGYAPRMVASGCLPRAGENR